MSPLRVLSRGYAIARDEQGAGVKSIRSVKPGDKLELILSDGKAGCLVSSVEENK